MFGLGYLLGYKAMKEVADEWKQMYFKKKEELEDRLV